MGCGISSRWESQRPVWVKRWILWRRYWKYACLTRNSSTSSMTAEKYARERIVPSGGAPGARKIRRAAAKTNAFSTAARGHAALLELGGQETVRLADGSRGSRRLAVGAEHLLDIFFPADGLLFHGIHLSLAGPATTDRRWSLCGSSAARGSAAPPPSVCCQKVVPLVIHQV